MTNPRNNPSRSLRENVNAKLNAAPTPQKIIRPLSDDFFAKGCLEISKVYQDGREEVVVEDKNLIVSLGRRLMSRLIAGAQGSPTILRGVQYGLRVIRTTTGTPASAWISFEQIAGTNEFLFSLYTDLSGTPEQYFQFAAGTQNLTTLAAAISAVSGWKADVMNSLGSIDATLLEQTPRADCLGTAGSYSNGWTSASTRRLAVRASYEQVLTAGTLSPLLVSGIRFGSEGHQPAATSLGKDVLSTDEYLTSMLRASDYLNSVEGQDSLPIVVTYTGASQVTFTATLAASMANGFNISEAALIAAGDTQIARKNFGVILKSSAFDLVARWTLIF